MVHTVCRNTLSFGEQIAGMKAAFPEDESHLVMLLVNQLEQACQDVREEEAKSVIFRATALLITGNSKWYVIMFVVRK